MSNNKRALVSGCTGQDGSYLLELLLEKGYEVFGLAPQRATVNTANIEHIIQQIRLIPADLLDYISLEKALQISQPDEIYNLGSQSFVKSSWDVPEYTTEVNGVGVLRFLEAMRRICPQARFYQASTSEMFGKVQRTPQNEETPFYPISPYGIAKLYGHWMTVNYRESYNLFACSGILFNHDSPRRGNQFVTQKIARAAVKIKRGLQDRLLLGNLETKRDIGHAKDYVRAMWLMLQQATPDDYVIASGTTHSIREILDVAFGRVELDWTKYIGQDEEFMRPTDIGVLLGDSSKARKQLGWATEHSFEDVITEMVDYQLQNFNP